MMAYVWFTGVFFLAWALWALVKLITFQPSRRREDRR